jgi:unsaturated chondroitin disaccharide hydrolase
MPDRSQLIGKCRAALSFAQKQLRQLVETHPDCFPAYTQDGRWKHEGERRTGWCEGLLGGQLWLIHGHTWDTGWRDLAEHYSRLIEHRKADRTAHDLGFVFWPTWKHWYDLTGDGAANQTVIAAGQTLASRFREKGGYLASSVGESSTSIDIMMNVGIIFYAAEQANDERLSRIAHRHCLTTQRYLMRGDGSTAQEGIFDAATGEFLRQGTRQGWRGDSTWARGQAWALYGFGTAYSFTNDARLLHTAQTCADYYIERTPKGGVPPNDWDEPRPPLACESSAAAIAASGLWDLAGLTEDPERAQRYRQYALRILDTLTTPEFLAADTPEWEGVLKHGIYDQRKGLGVDESTMWGDYYFLEALTKVIRGEG